MENTEQTEHAWYALRLAGREHTAFTHIVNAHGPHPPARGKASPWPLSLTLLTAL